MAISPRMSSLKQLIERLPAAKTVFPCSRVPAHLLLPARTSGTAAGSSLHLEVLCRGDCLLPAMRPGGVASIADISLPWQLATGLHRGVCTQRVTHSRPRRKVDPCQLYKSASRCRQGQATTSSPSAMSRALPATCANLATI